MPAWDPGYSGGYGDLGQGGNWWQDYPDVLSRAQGAEAAGGQTSLMGGWQGGFDWMGFAGAALMGAGKGAQKRGFGAGKEMPSIPQAAAIPMKQGGKRAQYQPVSIQDFLLPALLSLNPRGYLGR